MAAAIGEAAGIHRAIMIKKQARCADMQNQKRARSGAGQGKGLPVPGCF
jgi:hypothetical protein